MAGEIVAGWQARGKVDTQEAVVVDEVLGGPFLGRHVIALVPYLEPARASSSIRFHVGNFLEVDGHNAKMGRVDRSRLRRIRPHTKLESQLGTGWSRARKRNGFLTIST